MSHSLSSSQSVLCPSIAVFSVRYVPLHRHLPSRFCVPFISVFPCRSAVFSVRSANPSSPSSQSVLCPFIAVFSVRSASLSFRSSLVGVPSSQSVLSPIHSRLPSPLCVPSSSSSPSVLCPFIAVFPVRSVPHS